MARVLIADDEATVRRVMQLGLKNGGHEVAVAENGAVALAQIEARRPDVLVTDIEMPRMNGRQLCEAVVQRYPERRFAIFVLTSLAEREHRSWSSAMRDLHFLEKPVSIRTLLAKIDDALRERLPPVAAG
jgi:CheY-like chemotaxis protein